MLESDSMAARKDSSLNRRLSECQEELRRFAERRMDPSVRGEKRVSDVLQEAMIEAHMNREKLRGRGTQQVRGWLRQRVSSRVADEARRQKKAPRLVPIDVLCPPLPAANRRPKSPAEEALAQEAAARFRKAFLRLTREQRDALTGARIDGQSLEELAMRMGKTVSAVSMLIERAIKRLRAELGNFGAPE